MHTRSAVYTFIKFHLEGKGGECLSVCMHTLYYSSKSEGIKERGPI